MPTPMLWNDWSREVRAGVAGGAVALAEEHFMPRWAAADRAFLSPALKRSNGALPERTVRSKAAIALAMFSGVTSVSKTFWNCSR